MVRNRQRTSEKGNFSEDDMREAVLLVEQGMSVRKAAEEKGVKYPTLYRYVQKKKISDPNEVIRMRPNYECRKVFSEDQEKDLVDYIIKCSKMFYGLTAQDCRRLAYEMAEINSIAFPDTWKTNKIAGIDWLFGFRKRNPHLSLRTPEACSLSRATSFNRTNVNVFYDNLEQVLLSDIGTHFSDGTRIYNLDETNTSTVQKSQKVLAEKGSKQVSKCTSGEKGTTVTTCCIISATGNAIPPAMVFPRVHFRRHMTNDAPTGTLGLATSSGWMTSELFVQVMRHFIHHTKSSKESPTLLLFDNHDTHLSIEVIDLAKENGVTIVTFPPHCTHKLQPLDVGVYKAFKTYYNAAIDSWMMQHPGQTVSIYDVAGIVKIAHQRSLTPENIMSGFRKTGIFPFDRHIFTEDDFLCSYVTDRPSMEQVNQGASTSRVTDRTDEEQGNPKASTSVLLDQPEEEEASCKASTSELLDQPGDEQVNPSNNDILDQHFVEQTEELSNNGKENVNTVTPTSATATGIYKSPEQFKGYPKAGNRKTKFDVRRKRSVIATSTPEKNLLAEKKRLSMAKTPKRCLFKKQKKNESEEDFSETEMTIDDFYENNFEKQADLLHPDSLSDLQQKPSVGDFVLVQFNIPGKKEIFYIGKVMSQKDSDNDYDVSFLRKSNKMSGKFIKPVKEDRAPVHENQIKMILPKPSFSGQTKRQKSVYSFGIDFSLFNIG